MTLCLSHRSAISCLREAGASSWQLTPLRNKAVPSLVPFSHEVKQLGIGRYGFLERPLHVLVASESERRLIKDVVCHTAPARTLPRFIFKAPGGVLLEGPGLCLLHEAVRLPLPLLVQMGFELCGGYRIYPDNPRGFAESKPVATPLQLVRFVEAMGNAKGSRQLARALSYVCEGSRSPMETVIVLLLCLPPRLGGYGLPMPRLNYRVDVHRNGCKASANRYFVCDAFWPDAWLDVEYDSDLVHTGSTRIAHDAKRRNGLTSLGVTVITVTKQQVFNCDEMDRVAHAIAKALGWRLRMRGSGWVKARADLRRQLLVFGSERKVG